MHKKVYSHAQSVTCVYIFMVVYDFGRSFIRRKDCPCVAGNCLVFLEKILQLPLKTQEFCLEFCLEFWVATLTYYWHIVIIWHIYFLQWSHTINLLLYYILSSRLSRLQGYHNTSIKQILRIGEVGLVVPANFTFVSNDRLCAETPEK